jgi:peptidase S41-like protein
MILNMIIKKRVIVVVALFCLFLNLQSQEPKPISETEAIAAFAEIYGTVRYFHPSQEAAVLDWETFAVYGVEKVHWAKNESHLKQILGELFKPIINDMEFTSEPKIKSDYEIDTVGKDIRFWQHYGLGINENSIYRSSLINDKSKMSRSEGFGVVRSSVDISKYAGKEFKFTAWVKMEVAGFGNEGHLWVQVDRRSGRDGYFNNMAYDPIKDSLWAEYTITDILDADAETMNFGAFLSGMGRMWIDDFSMQVKIGENWKKIKLANADFERDSRNKLAKSWNIESINYEAYVSNVEFNKGKKSLEIKSINNNLQGMIYKRMPGFNERTKIKIADDLYCSFPLVVLKDRDVKTFNTAFNNLVAELESIKLLNSSGSGKVMQLQKMDKIEGSKLRLTVSFQASEIYKEHFANIEIMFIDNNQNIVIDNKNSSIIADSRKWRNASVVADIPQGATSLVVSAGLLGKGEIAIDDFKVEQFVNGKWIDAGFINLSFEKSEPGKSLGGWIKKGDGYDIEVMEGSGAKTGKKYLFISDAVTGLDANNSEVRLADLIITWNIYKHFFPYLDACKADLDGLLNEYIDKVIMNDNPIEFTRTMKEFVAQIPDGHADFSSHLEKVLTRYLPILCKEIDSKIVVVRSESNLIKRGDVIISVDSVPALDIYQNGRKLVSGSEHFREAKFFVRGFSSGMINSKAEVKILRNGSEITFELQRINNSPIIEFDYPAISKLGGNVYLVNLFKITMVEFRANLDKFGKAKGLIFDARAYVDFEKREILSYLSNKELISPNWLVPKYIYPNQENLEYDQQNWTIEPNKPRIKCKTALLIGNGSLSATETFIAIYKQHKLGNIVGSASAGTNGNINTYRNLPGGYTFTFTGMKVLNYDDSQFHLLGIAPDVEIKASLDDIIEGRDVVLDEAMKLMRKKK